MIRNGKNVCDNCGACFTCGTPRKILITPRNEKRELCTKCYNLEKTK